MPEHAVRTAAPPSVLGDADRAPPPRVRESRVAPWPYPGPTGPAADVGYASHYAETPSLEDLQRAFFDAAFGPEGRPNPVATLAETPKAPPLPSKPEAGGAPEAGERGFGLGRSREHTDDERRHEEDFKLHPAGKLSAGRQTTGRTDETGRVLDGEAAHGSVGRGGLDAHASRTQDGKTTAMGGHLNPITGEQSAHVSHGDEKRSFAISAGTKDGTTSVGASGKLGPVSAKASFASTNRVARGELGREGIDDTIRDFVGAASYVEEDTGHAVAGGGDAEYSVFGAGGSGHQASEMKRRHFSHAATDTAQPSVGPLGTPAPPKELEGMNGIADVDLGKLQRGEGYSFEESHQSGKEGHVKVVLSAGIADDEATLSQTVLARDERGDLRVMIAQSDEHARSGSVSAGDVASIGGKATKGDSASVTFTAHGPEGEKAVKEFQQTGLLPGADEAARMAAPDAFAAFERLRREWQDTRASAAHVTGDVAVYLQRRLNDLQAEMSRAAAPLNDVFLQHRDGLLPAPPGVTYDDHTTTHRSSDKQSVGALGKEAVVAGSSEAEWERGYRDGGRAHLEQGYGREEEHLIAPDESSRIVTDPKGFAKDGDPVAVVMGGKQTVNQKQRDTLARIGGEAFGMPRETLEAWRDGSLHEGQLADLAVTLTEGQLAKMRDTIARPNPTITAMMVSGARGIHEARARGDDIYKFADEQTKPALHAQLDQLYQAASAARMKQLVAEGKIDPDLLADGGMGAMLSRVESVKTPEDFVKLTPEEQKLVVATGAITMNETRQSSFECMRLVLQVKDKDQRNALLRQLYETNERRSDGAHGAIDFAEWAADASRSEGLSREERLGLTSGVSVRMEHAEEGNVHDAVLEAALPERRPEIIGKRLAEAAGEADPLRNPLGRNQSPEEQDAARYVHLLEKAADGGDRASVERAMSAAFARNPAAIGQMWETLAKDPARLAWANHLLEGTMFHRDLTKK